VIPLARWAAATRPGGCSPFPALERSAAWRSTSRLPPHATPKIGWISMGAPSLHRMLRATKVSRSQPWMLRAIKAPTTRGRTRRWTVQRAARSTLVRHLPCAALLRSTRRRRWLMRGMRQQRSMRVPHHRIAFRRACGI